jgi:hypothetical protein
MNVQAITLNIVDSLSKHSNGRKELDQTANVANVSTFKTNYDFLTSKSTQSLSDEDKTKINSIDWILYDPAQRFKLLEYVNLTMRYFLLEKKNFEATKLVFSKTPIDTIAVILSQYNCAQHNSSTLIESSNFNILIENLPTKVSNAIKEYICFKEYIVSVVAVFSLEFASLNLFL